MDEQGWSEQSELQAWVDRNTTHLDLVASWEELCHIYESLNFTDPMPDGIRIEEFKWVIKEINKFLTRTRTKMLVIKDCEAALAWLDTQFNSQEGNSITTRQALVYNKLKQRWIVGSGNDLQSLQSRWITEGEEENV